MSGQSTITKYVQLRATKTAEKPFQANGTSSGFQMRYYAFF